MQGVTGSSPVGSTTKYFFTNNIRDKMRKENLILLIKENIRNYLSEYASETPFELGLDELEEIMNEIDDIVNSSGDELD